VAVPVALVVNRVGKAGFLFAPRDVRVHATLKILHHIGVLFGDVVVLFRVGDEVVKLNFGLKVEVGSSA
jgi:hypothetical protein